MILLPNVYQISQISVLLIKIVYAVHLKYSSFWHSAGVKQM